MGATPTLIFGDPLSIALRNRARQFKGNHSLTSRWRARAAPIIFKVLLDTAGLPMKDIRRALRAAYPFGPRKMHPYRIWLDEVRRQVATLQGDART